MNTSTTCALLGLLSVSLFPLVEASAQDSDDQPVTTSEHLAFLEPLIGEWKGNSTIGDQESPTRVSFRWINQKTFVLQSMEFQGGDLEITHVIGWDPKTKQVKTWGFGGSGGYGEMVWTKKSPTNWIEESKDWTVPTGESARFRLENSLTGNRMVITGFFQPEGDERIDLSIQVEKTKK